MQFRKLFEPGRVGGLELKNRIVLPGMGSHLAADNGEVTNEIVDWYARRARGGAGLIPTILALPAVDCGR